MISLEIRLKQWEIQRKLKMCLYLISIVFLANATFGPLSLTIPENFGTPIWLIIRSICDAKKSPVCGWIEKSSKE